MTRLAASLLALSLFTAPAVAAACASACPLPAGRAAVKAVPDCAHAAPESDVAAITAADECMVAAPATVAVDVRVAPAIAEPSPALVAVITSDRHSAEPVPPARAPSASTHTILRI